MKTRDDPEYLKNWKINNPEKHQIHRTREQIKNRERRERVLYAYGNGFLECACCGEDYLDFLTLDHIVSFRDRGIKRDHPLGINWYAQLERDGYPPDNNLRVLCANCNGAVGRAGVTFESLREDLRRHRENDGRS